MEYTITDPTITIKINEINKNSFFDGLVKMNGEKTISKSLATIYETICNQEEFFESLDLSCIKNDEIIKFFMKGLITYSSNESLLKKLVNETTDDQLIFEILQKFPSLLSRDILSKIHCIDYLTQIIQMYDDFSFLDLYEEKSIEELILLANIKDKTNNYLIKFIFEKFIGTTYANSRNSVYKIENVYIDKKQIDIICQIIISGKFNMNAIYSNGNSLLMFLVNSMFFDITPIRNAIYDYLNSGLCDLSIINEKGDSIFIICCRKDQLIAELILGHINQYDLNLIGSDQLNGLEEAFKIGAIDLVKKIMMVAEDLSNMIRLDKLIDLANNDNYKILEHILTKYCVNKINIEKFDEYKVKDIIKNCGIANLSQILSTLLKNIIKVEKNYVKYLENGFVPEEGLIKNGNIFINKISPTDLYEIKLIRNTSNIYKPVAHKIANIVCTEMPILNGHEMYQMFISKMIPMNHDIFCPNKPLLFHSTRCGITSTSRRIKTIPFVECDTLNDFIEANKKLNKKIEKQTKKIGKQNKIYYNKKQQKSLFINKQQKNNYTIHRIQQPKKY